MAEAGVLLSCEVDWLFNEIGICLFGRHLLYLRSCEKYLHKSWHPIRHAFHTQKPSGAITPVKPKE